MEEPRKPFLDMFLKLSDHDVSLLYNILDVAHRALIYESTDEALLMDEFMTMLWIAARGERI